MSTPPDLLEERVQTVTRSGRAVRPPLRYEPDPDAILEDDFSDTPSDDDWGCREEPQTDDGCIDDLTYSEEDDFTAQDSQDSSYLSASDTSSSDDEDEDEDEDEDDDEDDSVPQYESDDMENLDDILDWDTLTADASEHYSSEDDQDL